MQAPEQIQGTTLFFVRHGETDYNRRGIVQGRGIDALLNATGRAQAEAVARRFADEPLDAIYSSTQRRAMETAERIQALQGEVSLYGLADLEEMDWGVFEGQVYASGISQEIDEVYALWQHGAYEHRITDGESILEVQARGVRAMGHILGCHPEGRVLVVTHGRFLRVLLASLLDAYGLERMHDIKHANTGVNHLVYQDGRFEARLLNCTLHLEELAPRL